MNNLKKAVLIFLAVNFLFYVFYMALYHAVRMVFVL